MIELQFRIEFATPFRVSTGHAGTGVDAAIDPTDPLPASSLKGVMRATAVTLGASTALVGEVFGSRRRESPWAWGSARPVNDQWAPPQAITRIALDQHHSTTRDMLAVVERTHAGAAEFTITQRGACSSGSRAEADALARHRALLLVAAQATRSLGGTRRRGLGWVHIRGLTAQPGPAEVALVLGSPA